MEFQRTQNINRPANNFEFAHYSDDDRAAEARLNALLEIERETAREKALYQERVETGLVKSPITTQNAFSYFGLMLGTFPPMALFGKFVANANFRGEEIWVIPFLVFVNAVCAGAGYFSGKLIGKLVAETEKWNWASMLLVSPLIGILWGIMAGGAGGIFIFLIGAIFGAIIAAMVGGVALPIFTAFHRWLKKGDVIGRDQFLPLALGITLIISAFILGLPIR
jgi:hypothetical protein